MLQLPAPRAKSDLRVLSLFSGAGGMDLGLEAAGFHCSGFVEIDETARRTIQMNRDWAPIGSGDVIELADTLTPAAVGLATGELDLMAGGPPCQPFSAAAQWAASGRAGMLDPRAATVTSTLALIERFLPRAVLMENVLGFVEGKGAALSYLQDELSSIARRHGVKYDLHWRLVNAADYGVPQNRRRVIIVALRDGGDFSWPEATFKDSPRTSWDALHDAPREDVPVSQGKWTPLLASIPEGHNYQWLTSRGGGPELFGYRTKYWNFLLKLSRSLPSWTLAASPGPSTGPFHWENRPLSSREQLRLQSFDDSWKLAGDYRARTKQAGNATPPLLAQVMGQAIRETLTGCAAPGTPRLLRAAPPRHALPVMPLPPEFLNGVGPKSAHAGHGRGPGSLTRLTT
ncbi:DNA cytosine methyltransferase [Plantibacter sp. T3]|uniref:DNA cytosine methyltransferase n=1 Tax=Plantibacter sp. T3 TaxID=2653161 RepID=UPI0012F121CB|nr:Cytosine-specific methyltransferase [Plantibacter sp. T3]